MGNTISNQKCSQCDKLSVVSLSSDNINFINLCVDCYYKYSLSYAILNDVTARQMNYSMEEMELVSPVPIRGPRYQVREFPITGDVTLNNINIDRSAIGVINTGSIRTIDGSISVIQGDGNPALANAIKTFSESIISSNEINSKIQNDILEILSVITSQIAIPENGRKDAIIPPLITQIATLLSGANGLLQVWNTLLLPLLKSQFSI